MTTEQKLEVLCDGVLDELRNVKMRLEAIEAAVVKTQSRLDAIEALVDRPRAWAREALRVSMLAGRDFFDRLAPPPQARPAQLDGIFESDDAVRSAWARLEMARLEEGRDVSVSLEDSARADWLAIGALRAMTTGEAVIVDAEGRYPPDLALLRAVRKLVPDPQQQLALWMQMRQARQTGLKKIQTGLSAAAE